MKPPMATVLGDERMGADLAHVLAQRRLLVLDDVEHLPRRVHVRRRRSRGRGARPAVLVATAQRVCGTTRTRSTPSRCTPRTIASRAASVTRPPGLRKIFASPGASPMQPQRVDPGVHAGHHGDPRVGDAVELLHARSARRRSGSPRAGRRSGGRSRRTACRLSSSRRDSGAENGWTWLSRRRPGGSVRRHRRTGGDAPERSCKTTGPAIGVRELAVDAGVRFARIR